MDYYTVSAARPILGVEDDTTVRHWISVHGLKESAYLVDRSGKKLPLYTLDNLLRMKEVHAADVARRGYVRSRKPGFTYTRLGDAQL